ncbi:hypothetical protein [Helicobacter pullorum]|uniref:hypothetical protein n=1 Tax=Helicobacter pullorum TaxID=35818 RepID=UPI000A637A44|nr:hypothetical protein [Helicobacter pullorum]
MSGNARFDSNNNEVIWEIKPKYYFLNTLTHTIILVFCVILLCVGIFTDIFTTLLAKIVWSIFFGFAIYHICDTLFGMVCFYITNNGIGFERKYLFGIQKKFFKFGEIEVSIGEYQVFVLYNHNEIFIAPLNTKGWYRRKNTYRLHFLNFNLSDDRKIYEMWDFIRKKSKTALESKGIDTNSINFNTLFICFLRK